MNTLFFMLCLSSSNTLLITSPPFQRHLSISAIIQKKYILFMSFAWLIAQKKTGSPLRDSRPGKVLIYFIKIIKYARQLLQRL